MINKIKLNMNKILYFVWYIDVFNIIFWGHCPLCGKKLKCSGYEHKERFICKNKNCSFNYT